MSGCWARVLSSHEAFPLQQTAASKELGGREESGHGRPSSLLQPASHPPRSSAAPEPSRPPQLHPLPSRGWGGPCQCCMLRTQPSGAALCPPRLTGRAGRVTGGRVLCGQGSEHGDVPTGACRAQGRWAHWWPKVAQREGWSRAGQKQVSLSPCYFFPFIHKEMDLGEGRQAEAGGRSLSYPSSHAMLGQTLILPAAPQLLPKRGILPLPEWFGAPCRPGAPGLCTRLLRLSQQSSPNRVAYNNSSLLSRAPGGSKSEIGVCSRTTLPPKVATLSPASVITRPFLLRVQLCAASDKGMRGTG